MPRQLRVFLCHASQDKPAVRELYKHLKDEEWIDPWLDEEKLSFGQHWTTAIEDALTDADVVIIFLSKNSVQKEGFVQRELNYAWELSLEKPRNVIFLIPFRLDDCQIPRYLGSRQWGDYFGEKKESTYQILLRSLKQRHLQKLQLEAAEKAEQEAKERTERETAEKLAREKAEKESAEKAARERAEWEAKEQAKREAAEKVAREKAKQEDKEQTERESVKKVARETKEKAAKEKEDTAKPASEMKRETALKLNPIGFGIAGVLILLWIVGGVGLNSFINNLPETTVPPTASATEPPIEPNIPSVITATFETTETSIPHTTTATFLPTAPFVPAPTFEIGSTMISEKDGMTMAYVPAGKFLMGSDDGRDDEKPSHQVYLNAFWIDQTEVTNAMYLLCVADGGCEKIYGDFVGVYYIGKRGTTIYYNYFDDPVYADYPIIVNWEKANDYCEWRDARLPTESEWEKAARGTDGRIYPWGNNVASCGKTNYYYLDINDSGNYCVSGTSRVGGYELGRSPYGIYDMAGNLAEWVSDWYSDTYYLVSPESNPVGPDFGTYKVVRGGSYENSADWLRTSARFYAEIDSRDIGFRCALDANP